jgi:hypothetical protein
MSQTNRFALTLETLAELAPQIRSAHADPAAGLPSLSEVLTEYSPLPQSALFLGLAEDGLPILLNLNDPVPGPLLIVGDPGSGKTALLKNIARAVDRIHEPNRVKYSVVTEHISEWNGFERSANCEGILPLKDDQIKNYLSALVEWAHVNKNEGQFLLLIIDDLNSIVKSTDIHQQLRWLLLRGTARNIWPIITLNANQSEDVLTWLDAFRTRLFGSIQNDVDVEKLTGLKNNSFKDLLAGSQFSMREGKNWLPFWIPNLD